MLIQSGHNVSPHVARRLEICLFVSHVESAKGRHSATLGCFYLDRFWRSRLLIEATCCLTQTIRVCFWLLLGLLLSALDNFCLWPFYLADVNMISLEFAAVSSSGSY